MKKIILLILSIFLLIFFTSCNKDKKNYEAELNNNVYAYSEILKNKEGKQLTVICTVFPVYDWCRNIIGGEENERFRLELMMKKGTDMHNFQPSVADLARLNSADLVFYIGGESDKWIEEALAVSKNKSQIRISLMKNMEELMKSVELNSLYRDFKLLEEDHFCEIEQDEGESEYDEHIWLSLNKANMASQIFYGIFSQLDSVNRDTYQENEIVFEEALKKLDKQFRIALAEKPVLLFADRFPFKYFTADYDLPYYAAFPGCSAETEASFSTVISLSEKIKENNLKTIYILENSNTKLADQIIETAGTSTKVKVLNSLQSISESEIRNGVTYLKLMGENLEVLCGND